MLELWGMCSTSTGVVAPDRVLSIVKENETVYYVLFLTFKPSTYAKLNCLK